MSANRWWNGSNVAGSMTATDATGLFEVASMTFFIRACELGTPVKRFSCFGDGDISKFYACTASMGARGARSALCERTINDGSRGCLQVWEDSIAMTTFDGTIIKVDFCTTDIALYDAVSATISGTLL